MIKGLVVAEIALALILLTGAGLLLRALLLLEGAPTGIVAERVLTLRMETLGLLPQQSAPAETDSGLSAQGRYFRAIEERVGQIPGVRAAGFVTRLHVQSPGNSGAEMPPYDPAVTPARGLGVVVELVRTWPGARRCDAPASTRSRRSARAPAAITADHALDVRARRALAARPRARPRRRRAAARRRPRLEHVAAPRRAPRAAPAARALRRGGHGAGRAPLGDVGGRRRPTRTTSRRWARRSTRRAR